MTQQSLTAISRTRDALRLRNWGICVRRLDDARAVLRQAVEEQEHNWGLTHRRLVEPLAVLAAVSMAQSRLVDADSLYRRALSVAEASMVPGHPQIATVRAEYVAHLRATARNRQADSVERGGRDTVH